MLISTCNRVELLTHGWGEQAVQHSVQLLAEHSDVSAGEIRDHLRFYRNLEAVRHAFRVAAGLDSMVLGEPQILGQWKAAFMEAETCGGVGHYLGRLGQRTLHVAKDVRSQTEVGRWALSVASIAVSLAEQIFAPLADNAVLVLGAGEMAELAAMHFESRGVRRLQVANRTRERAEEVAAEVGAEVVAWDLWPRAVAEADVILVGAGGEERLFDADRIRQAIVRKPRPRLWIDLAVPRAVDPSVGKLPDVFLYSIDDLEEVGREHRERRQAEAESAEKLVDAAADRFRQWYDHQQLSPLIRDLTQWLESLRVQEVGRTLRGRDQAELEQALEQATAALSRRMVQAVAAGLKRMPEQTQAARVLRAVLLGTELQDNEQRRKKENARRRIS